jgi:multiple sugar transport system permease protein
MAIQRKQANQQGSSPVSRRLGFGIWRPGQQNEAYLFLLPSLLGFAVFVVLPIIGAFLLSFYEWNLTSPAKFIGLDNYSQLIFRDGVFRKVLGNTLFYAATIVPLQLILGLLMALALNQGIKGLELYRLIYFMPVVTNIVAVAIVFQWLLNRDFGVANAWVWQLAEATGWKIAPPDWLNSSFWAKPAVVLLTLWKNVGFTMVIYLAGLQGVSESFYDAAKVDGASPWQRFRFVTLPLVSPTTFFLLVIQMIGAFQLFSEPFVMTQGGPAQASLSIVMYIYQNAFQFGRMGKATAIAWLLFAIIFVFTLIQTRLQRRWVHYEAGD